MSFVVFLFVILLVIFLLQFYFFGRLRRSINLVFSNISNSKLKRSIHYFFFYINLYPIIGLAISAWIRYQNIQDYYPPENIFLDVFFIFPFWLFVFILVQSILFLLPGELIRFMARLIKSSKKEVINRYFAYASLIVIGLSTLYVSIRVPYDFNSVETRRVTFKKKDLSESLQNFKIAHVSDIQADHFTSGTRIERYIEKINQEKPDLILIAGDIITSTPKYIGYAGKILSKLEAKYGVYSCIGDHDNWAYRPNFQKSVREITDSLAINGVFMKDNDNEIIKIGDSEIGLTFITHTYSNKINPNKLELTINEVDTLDLKILLTHQPRQFLIDEAKNNNYDLFLAGHTHGGQVTFLFPFLNLTPTLIETFYVHGDFYFGKMLMIVNRGLGMSISPLRYNSTPEVTIITLED